MTRDWSPLAIAYLVLAVAGLIGTWIFNGMAIAQTNDFVTDLVTSGPAVSSITVDLLVAAVAGSVFIIVEARRLGMRFGWLYVAASRSHGVRLHVPAVPGHAPAPAGCPGPRVRGAGRPAVRGLTAARTPRASAATPR